MTMSLPTTHAAQPLQWWTDAELDAIRVGVQEACAAWARDWLGGASKAETSVARADEPQPANRRSWVPVGTRGERAAWMQARNDAVEDMLHKLFPTEPRHSALPAAHGIAYNVAAKAQAALIDAVQSRVGLDPPLDDVEPGAALFKPWSGSVIISVAILGRSTMAVLLNSPTARSMLAAGAALEEPGRPRAAHTQLVPLAQALADRRLVLRVGLSSCELDIGTLESLRDGDIVPLPHSLDAPLLVSTAQGVQVCVGFLGRHNGFKAIELAREVETDPEAQFHQNTQRDA